MDTAIDPRLTVGGNNPPDSIEALAASLRETHGPLIERGGALADMTARLPASCDDADTAGKLADAIKSCTAFTKNADAARVAAKEPHLAAGRAVDGFFKKLADPVDALKTRMGALLTGYQRAEADKERRRLQAIADEERRIAQEAERQAREAARIAREAKEAEERRAAEVRAEADRIERARLAEIAAEEKRAAEARAATEALAGKARQEAQEAEERRAAFAKAEAEAKARAARELHEAEEKRAAAARAAAREAEETAAAEARDVARSARSDANTAKAAAGVKAADLSRARTDLGVMASLRTTWAFDVEDAAAVPREFLSVNEGAIRVAIKAATTKEGKCPLSIPGVKIYAKQESVVR